MRFFEECAAHLEVKDYFRIREECAILVGKYFESGDLDSLARVLIQIGIAVALIKLPHDYFKPPTIRDMDVDEARNVLICVWGYSLPDSHRLFMLYSAVQSLLRSEGLDIEKEKERLIKVFIKSL